MAGHSFFIRRERCPICGKSDTTPIHTQAFDEQFRSALAHKFDATFPQEVLAGIPYEIRQCRACTLYFQVMVPAPEHADYFYPGEHTLESLEKKRRSPLLDVMVRAREAEKVAILLDRAPYQISVLEFGSGWGMWAKIASAYGYAVTAVETNDGRIGNVKAMGIATHTHLAEVPDESFDFVFSDQVFEHVNDPGSLMRELARKLRKGGLAKIAVPDAHNARALLAQAHGRPVPLFQPFQHINGFTHRALVELCAQAGLSLLPISSLVRRYVTQVRPARGLDYLQESLRAALNQMYGTALYFQKRA